MKDLTTISTDLFNKVRSRFSNVKLGDKAGVVITDPATARFFDLDFTQPTLWVVLLYGFFMNLNNFGMDQNYVQRYHTTTSVKEAAKSVWLCVYLYVPISLIFLG